MSICSCDSINDKSDATVWVFECWSPILLQILILTSCSWVSSREEVNHSVFSHSRRQQTQAIWAYSPRPSFPSSAQTDWFLATDCVSFYSHCATERVAHLQPCSDRRRYLHHISLVQLQNSTIGEQKSAWKSWQSLLIARQPHSKTYWCNRWTEIRKSTTKGWFPLALLWLPFSPYYTASFIYLLHKTSRAPLNCMEEDFCSWKNEVSERHSLALFVRQSLCISRPIKSPYVREWKPIDPLPQLTSGYPIWPCLCSLILLFWSCPRGYQFFIE